MRAYGSGATYAAVWSEPSTFLPETTSECVTPVFEETEYTFELAEDASVSDAVGTVSAADPNNDTMTYSIIGGNEDGKFAVNSTNGEITVAASLDYETIFSYTLTVEVDDGRGGTATASVEISVGDVAEDQPPAP